MIVNISNEILSVALETHGAEIRSIVKDGKEYMWERDETYWEDCAPVLFPMVSSLLDDKYTYKGATYSFPQHGFASRSEFDVIDHRADSITLRLVQDEYTASVYPFEYDFTVTFTLEGNKLNAYYKVVNTSADTPMYFNMGSHEGYALFDGGTIDDYVLEFGEEEHLVRLMLDRPVWEGKTFDFGNTDTLELSDSYFAVDGIFFKDIRSNRVTLRRKGGEGSLTVHFDCDKLGFWKMPEAKFICVEPWDGFCPYEGDGYELCEKRFINTLAPKGEYTFYHGIEIN